MIDFVQRLKQRKLVQWALAYLAAAWVLLQVLGLAQDSYGWPRGVMQLAFGVLALGFVVTLVLAWYHGDRGVQRASGTELLLIALVLAVGGGLLWHFERGGPPVGAAAHALATRHGDASAADAQHATATASPATNTLPSPAASVPAKSIAVLPFENLSGDPRQAYFSDGITEEILNALAQIPDLKVTARTSAFAFSSANEDPRKIGETLGVANLLEGSVQKSGDEVRINVRLIDARTGYQRWSEKYDRKLTNIFVIEDDISNAIASKLRVQLSNSAGQAPVAQTSIDSRAHDFYLRGLALLAARGPGLRDAVAAFKNAVKIDPHYADAWGALAEAQALYPDYALGTMQGAYRSALADARHALSLNPDVASAYVAQGMVYKSQWRWPEADQAFHRALALAPGDAEAVDQYAQFLYAAGQLEPALGEIERAQKLDPLSAVIGANRASILGALHRYDAAAAQSESTLAAHPDFALAHSIAALLAINRHRYAEAEAQNRLANKLKGNDPNAGALLVRGMADPAQRAAAVHSLEMLPANAGLRRDHPIVYALFLTELGERDRALDVLQGNVVNRDSEQSHVLWNPSFDPIRNDPRFKAVLKKMGLPYTPAEAAAYEPP